uniref:Ribosomal protein S4 n=1 Tax=Proteromonas lacertae TaxID=42746 RepID=E2EA01_PROLC|nr:ribosomal protein S4 [Proteromonas lacertae]ADD46356.1 ribosomal protein S4 [Proteromonas lacertae]
MLFNLYFRLISQDINLTKKVKKHLTKQRYTHFSKYKISYFLRNKLIFKNLKLYFFHTKKWKFYDNFFLHNFLGVNVKRQFYSLKFISKQFLKKNSGAYFTERLFRRSLYNTNYIYNRFDLVLYRTGFASSLKSARQLILHGFFFINHISIRNPNFLLSCGDLIEINLKKIYFLPFISTNLKYISFSNKFIRYFFRIFNLFSKHKIYYFKKFIKYNVKKNKIYLNKIINVDLFYFLILNKILYIVLLNNIIITNNQYKKLINILYFNFKNIKLNIKINNIKSINLNFFIIKYLLFLNKNNNFINNYIKLFNYYNFNKNLIFSIEKYYLTGLLTNFKSFKIYLTKNISQNYCKLYYFNYYSKYSYRHYYKMIKINKTNFTKKILPYTFKNKYYNSYQITTNKIIKQNLINYYTLFYTYSLKLSNLSEIDNKIYYLKQFLNLNKTFKQYSDVEIDFSNFRFIYLGINSNYFKKSLLSQNLISTFILRFYKKNY